MYKLAHLSKLTDCVIVSLAVLALCSSTWAQGTAPGIRYRAEVNKPFDTVIEEIEFAITEHNFRITGSNRVGEVIGERHGIPFPHSLVIHFCNLEYAKRLLEIDADYLLHMPCKIAVYEKGEKVIVETMLLPEDHRAGTVNDRINTILRAIVTYVLD